MVRYFCRLSATPWRTLPDGDGLWVEVSDVLMAMVITSLLSLDPHDMTTWDWKVDTYRVPAL